MSTTTPTDNLFTSITRRNPDAVKAALAAGADPKAIDSDGLTPLHVCCMSPHPSQTTIMTSLLTAGADPTLMDSDGNHPATLAAACGHTNLLQELRRLHPSTWTALSRDGIAPIHAAVEDHRVDTVRAMLAADPTQVSIKTADGLTPVQTFYRLGAVGNPAQDEDLLTVLLDADPDPKSAVNGVMPMIPGDEEFVRGTRPLHWAIAFNRLRIAKDLLKRGADVNAASALGRTALVSAVVPVLSDISCARTMALVGLLLDHDGVDVNHQDANGATATMLACATGGEAVIPLVRELLRRGADVHQVDIYGQTALHYAMSLPCTTEAVLTGLLLLAAGARPGVADVDGVLPPQVQAQDGDCTRHAHGVNRLAVTLLFNRHVVTAVTAGAAGRRQLCPSMAGTSSVDHEGTVQALDKLSAVVLGLTDTVISSPTVVKRGLAAVISTGQQRQRGLTPLHIAARDGDAATLQRLLSQDGVEPDAGCKVWTPLAYAVEGEHMECLGALLAAGANVNLPTGPEELTPAQIAAINMASPAVLKMLLDGGGNPDRLWPSDLLGNDHGMLTVVAEHVFTKNPADPWLSRTDDRGNPMLLMLLDSWASIFDKYDHRMTREAHLVECHRAVKLLVERCGLDVNAANVDTGYTAAFRLTDDDVSLVDVLVAAGADLEVEVEDETAEEFCRGSGYKIVADALKRAGMRGGGGGGGGGATTVPPSAPTAAVTPSTPTATVTPSTPTATVTLPTSPTPAVVAAVTPVVSTPVVVAPVVPAPVDLSTFLKAQTMSSELSETASQVLSALKAMYVDDLAELAAMQDDDVADVIAESGNESMRFSLLLRNVARAARRTDVLTTFPSPPVV